MAMGDYKPTKQSIEFKKEVSDRIDAEIKKLDEIFNGDIPKFNTLVKTKAIDAVVLEKDK